MTTDTGQTDTTPDALPFIGGVVLAVPCRVPQNNPIQVKAKDLEVGLWRLDAAWGFGSGNTGGGQPTRAG